MLEVYKEQYQKYPLLVTVSGREMQQSRKGRSFNIRHLDESEDLLLTDFFKRLSSITLWTRYFTGYPALSDEMIDQEIKRLNKIRTSNGIVLVATVNLEGKEEIIGVGEMIPLEEPFSTAELAVTLRDDYQREGIGSAVAKRLVQEAAKKGVATLQAETMVHNRATLRIWQKLKLPYSFHTDQHITTMVALLRV